MSRRDWQSVLGVPACPLCVRGRSSGLRSVASSRIGHTQKRSHECPDRQAQYHFQHPNFSVSLASFAGTSKHLVDKPCDDNTEDTDPDSSVTKTARRARTTYHSSLKLVAAGTSKCVRRVTGFADWTVFGSRHRNINQPLIVPPRAAPKHSPG